MPTPATRLADAIWATWGPRDRASFASVWALHDEVQHARDRVARAAGLPAPVEGIDWRKAMLELRMRVERWRGRCALCDGAESLLAPCRRPGCRGRGCRHGPTLAPCPRCQAGAESPPAA